MLPPAVAGIGLLAALRPWRGCSSDEHPRSRRRPSCSRSPSSSSPLYIRQAIAAFEAVDPDLVAASRTLGAGPAPHVLPRRAAARARRARRPARRSPFARGLGEFGATIMFAGSLQGVTQTLPLAIYAGVRASTSTRRSRWAPCSSSSARRCSSSSSWCSRGNPLGRLRASSSLVRAEARARGRAHRRARRAVGRGQELGPARDRRARARPSGRIALDDEVWLDAEDVCRAPDERRVGLVFQEYALFPHLSVRAERRVSAARSVSTSCSSASASPTSRRRVRASCRAASGSGSRSRGRSRAIRACCCSTSRSRRSTRTRRTRCAARAAGAATGARAADADRHARLRGRGGARRDRRRARRRASCASSAPRPSSSSQPGDPFVASFTGANLLHGAGASSHDDGADARAPRERRGRLLDRPARGRGRRRRLSVGRFDRPRPRGRLGAESRSSGGDRLGRRGSATACACESAR